MGHYKLRRMGRYKLRHSPRAALVPALVASRRRVSARRTLQFRPPAAGRKLALMPRVVPQAKRGLLEHGATRAASRRRGSEL